ncbi:MAG: EAL domain-containing protein [Granulosicoccus sp.]
MTSSLTVAALETAMKNNELVLYYQPKVSLLSGSIIGAEALVRWRDGMHGIIAPSEFLPLAESGGLLHDLTLRLLDQVISASSLLKAHPSKLSLSINVAPDDLASNTISNRIGQSLEQKTIRPEDLQVEITESAVMGNVERVCDDLIRLKKLGIRILMDDFGTGYSSIDRLSQLPFDALKLDQGIVKRMGHSRQNLDVVRSCISMARELGMTSVAEGIENAAAYNFLIAHGCEEAQGFYIGRPMSLDDFKSFVSDTHDFQGSQLGRVHQALLNLIRFRKSLIDAAFCQEVSRAGVLASVADPDLGTDVSGSRLGQWYYASKTELTEFKAYRDMEIPLREAHSQGLEFLSRLRQAHTANDISRQLAIIDLTIDRLIKLFHDLECALLEQGMH